ncbi:MAG: hypothetical protein A2086_11005 [Spirochaetes bacterium GWD1_27_9]|nr:MAG: hypothetical protein A2Z98_17190 [Spirochaetes bacterium GWB1_27_13]OHD22339.1 MAG: hypothetical protein A2Y34_06005 [Spirochaetes bacterium GWC1_27_15]OHD38390.1 MAG: hypothetical protein A2086_11005 [Spirochaetes bacterium GWD1_27_9]
MRKFYIGLSCLVFIFFSCITFNFNHIIEKFIEYDNINFNNVKKINIISKNKFFASVFRDYLNISFRNRGISLPNINVTDKVKDELDYELNFHIYNLNYEISENWEKLSPNSIKYWKTIKAKIGVKILKTPDIEKPYDMTNDLSYTITEEKTVNFDLSKNDKSLEKKIKNYFFQIDNYSLFYGLIDKIFKNFLSKRIKTISRELINFKMGLHKDLLKAYNFLKTNRIDEALIIFEQIYSDENKSYYVRSIAAYNIGIIKAMQKDYDTADIYFNRYDELEEERLKDIIRF